MKKQLEMIYIFMSAPQPEFSSLVAGTLRKSGMPVTRRLNLFTC